jgi:glycosyltransferase involved in cell wall biosynthesis
MNNNGNSRFRGPQQPSAADLSRISGTFLGDGEAPLVSVIIPAYRCAEYIAQTIESILSQSFTDYEIVIINDGSPDTALLEKVLEPYREKICYLKQGTRGPSGARNTGILKARGKYVAFLDSDDYWEAEHLSKHMGMLKRDQALDLVYCDYFLVKAEKPSARAFSVEPQSPPINFDSLLVERCTIGTSTTVISRAAIIGAGLFDESLMRCEDFDMWLRLAFGGARMAYHSDAPVFHRITESGLSADRWSMKKDRIRVYEKMASTLPISVEQLETIHQLIKKAEADCHIDELKHAVERGDYEAAQEAMDRARAIKDRWKLKFSAFALKLAPGLFRRFHLARARHLAPGNGHANEDFAAEFTRDGNAKSGENQQSPVHASKVEDSE